MKNKVYPKRTRPKHARLYAVLRRNEHGELEGYVEHSFSMSWERNQVRVWREWELNYNPAVHGSKFTDTRYHEIEKWLPKNGFLVRLNSKNCPIQVIMPKGIDHVSKSYWRNQPFTLR